MLLLPVGGFLTDLRPTSWLLRGDSKVHWFDGSYSEYEADWRQRSGNKDPSRIKFRKLATV